MENMDQMLGKSEKERVGRTKDKGDDRKGGGTLVMVETMVIVIEKMVMENMMVEK